MRKLVLLLIVVVNVFVLGGCTPGVNLHYVGQDLKEFCQNDPASLPGVTPLGPIVYEINRVGEPQRRLVLGNASFGCSLRRENDTVNSSRTVKLPLGPGSFIDAINSIKENFDYEFITEETPYSVGQNKVYTFYLSDKASNHITVSNYRGNFKAFILFSTFDEKDGYSKSSERKRGLSFFEWLEIQKRKPGYKDRVAKLSRKLKGKVNKKNRELIAIKNKERRQRVRDRAEAYDSTFGSYEKELKSKLSSPANNSSPSSSYSASSSNSSNSSYSSSPSSSSGTSAVS